MQLIDDMLAIGGGIDVHALRPPGSRAVGGAAVSKASDYHLVAQYEVGANGETLRRRCVRCSESGKRVESTLYCGTCHKCLCVKCFTPYHEESK